MRAVITILLMAVGASGHAELVAWWMGDDMRDSMGRSRLSFLGDAAARKGAFEFSGNPYDVAFVPDHFDFEITGSLSISCRVFPRAFASPFATSPQSQIVFRGDDRPGLDPYHMTLGRDGYFYFAVEGAGDGNTAFVNTPARLNRWTHLLGVIDVATGKLRLFVDGKLASEITTGVRPLGPLDRACSPGVSIGNTQFPQGSFHRQPFDGFIRDVRIYNSIVTPEQAMR